MKEILTQAIAPYVDDYSGAYLFTRGNAPLLSGSCGYANLDFQIPNTLDTKFDAASVTKVFTAAAILSLVQRQMLSLDALITDLIDLSGTQISKEITIRHLLTHTSGMADDADEEAGEDYAALFIDTPNYSIRNCKDFLPNFAYKPAFFKPGKSVRYNNCAFVLLGLVMEVLTGKDCRHVISEAVFQPCEMKDTGFYAKEEIEPNRAEGYFPVRDDAGNFLRWKKNIYSYPPIGTPDGGVYTTVSDLDKFMGCLLAGKLLSKEMTAAFLQPQCPFTREYQHGIWTMGYAFEFIKRQGEIFCMYKEGVNDGVDAITAYYPNLDLRVHMLSNQNDCLWRMYGAVQDALAAQN